MIFLKEITKLIGWLSGSVAGIAAILYACGYLASQTFLHLLGIGGLVSYDYQIYLQRGANFLIDALGLTLSVLLPLTAMLIVSGIVGYLFCLGVKRWLSQTRFTINFQLGWVKIHKQHPLLGWSISYGLLLLLFFLLLFRNMELFEAPLNISGLLYDADRMAFLTGSSSDLKGTIVSWIIHQQSDALKGHFTTLIMLELSAGLLLLLAWHVSEHLPFQNLLISPFVIIFALYISLLPMVYGPLMVKIEFAPVSIEMTAETASASAGNDYYLVASGEEGLTLWTPSQQRLIWLPKRELRSVAFLHKELPIKPQDPME